MLPNLDSKVNIFSEREFKIFKFFTNIKITNLNNVQKKINTVIIRNLHVGIRQYATKLLHIEIRKQNVEIRQHIKKVHVVRRQGETFTVGTRQYEVNKHFGSRWNIIGTRQNNKVNVGRRRSITKPVGTRYKNKFNCVGTRQTKIAYKKEGSEKTIISDTYVAEITTNKKHVKLLICNNILIRKSIERRQCETFKFENRQHALIDYFRSRCYIIGTRKNNKLNIGLRRLITKSIGTRQRNKLYYVGTRHTKITYKKEGSKYTTSSDAYATVTTPVKKCRKLIICNKHTLTSELFTANRYKVVTISGTWQKNILKIKIGFRQFKVIYKSEPIKNKNTRISEPYTTRITFKRRTTKYISNKKCVILILCKNLLFKMFMHVTHYSINFRGINYSTGSRKMGERSDISIMRMDLCSSEEENRGADSSNKENTPITKHSTIKENPQIRGKNKERELSETGEISKKALFTPILDTEDRNNKRNSREAGRRINQQGMDTIAGFGTRTILNESILIHPNDKGEPEKNRKRKSLNEKSGTQAGKIINTEHKRSKLSKIMDQMELKDCKEACCTNLRVSNRTKRKCNCTIITTIEALEMPFLTLHNRKKKYIKNNPCPVGSMTRKSTINQIKKKFLRGDVPMLKELKCNKLKDKEIRILRMWHYLDNTAFIIKQTGTKNDITKLFHELANLSSALYNGCEQLGKIIEADEISRQTVIEAETIKKAEIQEATLAGEWILKLNKQVKLCYKKNTLKVHFFRKMANIEILLNNIGEYPEQIQKIINEILQELKNRKIKNVKTVRNRLKCTSIHKVKLTKFLFFFRTRWNRKKRNEKSKRRKLPRVKYKKTMLSKKGKQTYQLLINLRSGDIETNPGPPKIPEPMILEEEKLSTTLELPEKELYQIKDFNFEEFLISPHGIITIKKDFTIIYSHAPLVVG